VGWWCIVLVSSLSLLDFFPWRFRLTSANAISFHLERASWTHSSFSLGRSQLLPCVHRYLSMVLTFPQQGKTAQASSPRSSCRSLVHRARLSHMIMRSRAWAWNRVAKC
jgi:hypothetical protein